MELERALLNCRLLGRSGSLGPVQQLDRLFLQCLLLRDRGRGGNLTQARDFNLMFETTMGPVKDAGATVYLRPETAQGIFVNFKNVLQFARKKPPFGIAQIGKAFRNEIVTGPGGADGR